MILNIDDIRDHHDRRAIYQDAKTLWGIESQFGMLQEEAGELIAAVNRFLRGRDRLAVNLADELADVLIIIEDIVQVSGLEVSVRTRIDGKLDRLDARLRQAVEELNS